MNAPRSERQRERVLLVHNRYQQRGGEDTVLEAEAALLQSQGHAVELYERHNDEVESGGRISLALDTIWSRRTSADFAALATRFRPDIVHVHNTLPLVSPSIYWAAARAGVPVVQTLHNFRLICPQAMLLREGRVCESCVGRVPWPAVQHRCYRGSAAASAAVAGMLQLHRAVGTWQRKVTLYIALNEFCKAKLVQGGLPAERVRIKPNHIDLPPPAQASRSGFLFVGRLSHEKGVQVLAQACERAAVASGPGTAPLEMRVAGTGPDAGALEGRAGITLLGALQAPQVYAQMVRAAALVLPSIWYESFPRTLVEAWACGLPVVASRLGAMASLVQDGVTGVLFEPGNAADLAAKLQWAQQHPAELARMGRAARAQYEAELTGAATYGRLRAIYAEASVLNSRFAVS